MNYIDSLATARKVQRQAVAQLTRVTQNTTIDPELEKMAIERNPEGWAKCLEEISKLAATLPALRSAEEAASEKLARLEAIACWRCAGSGRYSGPTRATRRGVPYCFYCDGKGHK